MAHYVRRMRPEDIERVLQIDREAFPTEWPPNLKREMGNSLAHYIVACQADGPPEPVEEPPPSPMSLLDRLRAVFRRGGPPRGRQTAPDPAECITGFAGIWVMAGEAHITSIASAAAFRGQGIGELLLRSVIRLSEHLRATVVTLEVRASNRQAQALYTKYGFREVGVRRGYYSDNREDALIMTTERLDSASFRDNVRAKDVAYRERWGIDRYALYE